MSDKLQVPEGFSAGMQALKFLVLLPFVVLAVSFVDVASGFFDAKPGLANVVALILDIAIPGYISYIWECSAAAARTRKRAVHLAPGPSK